MSLVCLLNFSLFSLSLLNLSLFNLSLLKGFLLKVSLNPIYSTTKEESLVRFLTGPQ